MVGDRTTPASSALSDLRVLDLSDRLSGAFCARLFGDFGAKVTLLESPAGHPLRREPPFLDDVAGPERSLLHAFVNANKRSRTFDGASLAAEVAATDVIVTTAAPLPDTLDEALEARRDNALHVSVTPYGLDGPLAGAPGNDLTLSAMSGWADICGYEGEPPLQLPSHQSSYLAGVSAFVGALGALARRDVSAEGSIVDASELEAMVVSTAPWSLALIYEGLEGFTAAVHRHVRDGPGFLRARDGELVAGFGQGPFWTDAMHVLGLSELADDGFDDPAARREHLASIRPRIETRIAELSRWEVFEALSTVRSVSGVVQNIADLLDNPHSAARDYFVETKLDDRPLRIPGAPARLSGTPWRLRLPAPKLGEHDRERRDEPPRSRAAQPPAKAPPATAPLEGVRVLTFTQAWSGPLGTELLALLGADVVQIEARRRPDVWRTYSGGYDAPISTRRLDPDRRQRAWNVIGLYNGTNINKRAITLDMGDPRGAELFWRLAPKFDVFAESFSPHTLANWGVTFEAMRDARPDVIFAALSGYGATGPYSAYPANGGTIEPMSGLSSVTGYLDGPAQNTGGLIPDPVGGMHFASAILVALHHRARTGEGQYIDLSMMDAMSAHLGDAVLEQAANGRTRRPIGNRHPRHAPHGIYAAADGWLALAAESDEAWQALAAHLGRPELAADARFADATARKRHEDELDAVVGAWCADQRANDTANTLRRIGCPAARVVELTAVLDDPDPQLRARGFVQEVEHAEAGLDTLAVAPWRLSGQTIEATRPSPAMGEHSFEVFEQELGMTASEYEELVAAGVTGDMPPE